MIKPSQVVSAFDVFLICSESFPLVLYLLAIPLPIFLDICIYPVPEYMAPVLLVNLLCTSCGLVVALAAIAAPFRRRVCEGKQLPSIVRTQPLLCVNRTVAAASQVGFGIPSRLAFELYPRQSPSQEEQKRKTGFGRVLTFNDPSAVILFFPALWEVDDILIAHCGVDVLTDDGFNE